MDEFVWRHLQRFLANVSVSPSVTGGNLPGVKEAIIQSLSELPLREFADPLRFVHNLNSWTYRIGTSCTRRVPWGTARKCLNIFLRDATYNHYMRGHYHFDAVESLLEVPLDSRVRDGLRSDSRRIRREIDPHLEIPQWFDSIISLSPETHTQYQDAACAIAQHCNTLRVHLDLKYWPRA